MTLNQATSVPTSSLGLEATGGRRWTHGTTTMEHETCSEAAIMSSHDRSSTVEMSGRGKSRSLCAAHDATCGSNCESPSKSSVSQRPSRASRRDLLQEAA